MLHVAEIAFCSQINIKTYKIQCGQKVQLLNDKPAGASQVGLERLKVRM